MSASSTPALSAMPRSWTLPSSDRRTAEPSNSLAFVDLLPIQIKGERQLLVLLTYSLYTNKGGKGQVK